MTDWPEIPEAHTRTDEHGRVPIDDGWFVVNIADAPAAWSHFGGFSVGFEGSQPPARFPHFGINVQVLQPGERNAMYHQEHSQEAFLVLQGQCIAIVEEQERHLRQWDFVHCPPGTAHVFVGAGDGPCAMLMVGARLRDQRGGIRYPTSEVADRHGASVATTTDSPREAYADEPPQETRAPEWPLP